MHLMSSVTNQAVREVLESFQTSDLEGWCRRRNLDVARVRLLRAAFISGGVERLQANLDPLPWLQVNLALTARDSIAASTLPDSLDLWLQQGRFGAFFFLNKFPGIRLRFHEVRAGFASTLEAELQELQAGNIVHAWWKGSYNPELYQFGGEEGLRITHEFFTMDSLAILQYQRLRRSQAATLKPTEFSLLLLDRLAHAVVEDPAELWDLWCKMELTGRSWRSTKLKGNTDASLQAIRELLGGGLARVAPAEREILERYREQVVRIGTVLRAAESTGRLLWGIREIVPFWVIFHWNRLNVTFKDQVALVILMTTLLNPRSSPGIISRSDPRQLQEFGP